MAGKKYQLRTILKQTIKIIDAGTLWTDRYKAALKPNTKNLYKSHKVPEFKQRFG